jgi:hypothetical protein
VGDVLRDVSVLQEPTLSAMLLAVLLKSIAHDRRKSLVDRVRSYRMGWGYFC